MSDVTIPRRSLRRMRTLVAGMIFGFLILAVAMVIVIVEDTQRCHAGNQFRREDLPAAFQVHDRRLGRELGATDERIASFEAGFQDELLALFPKRDCSLLF